MTRPVAAADARLVALCSEFHVISGLIADADDAQLDIDDEALACAIARYYVEEEHMKKWIVTACLISSIGSAHADAVPPLPSYDPIAHCQAEVKAHRTLQGEGRCVDQQYDFRKMAADDWLEVAPSARAECLKVNQYGDYITLYDCIESHKRDKEVQ
jgi:hypothetical protein